MQWKQMYVVQPRNRGVEESLQEGRVHLLEKPIVEDTRLKLGDWFSLEEVQVLCCHNARHHVRAIGRFDFKPGLSKEKSLGAQGFPNSSTTNPGDGMLSHSRQHLHQHIV